MGEDDRDKTSSFLVPVKIVQPRSCVRMYRVLQPRAVTSLIEHTVRFSLFLSRFLYLDFSDFLIILAELVA